MDGPLYTTREAARMLNVCEETLLRYVRKGLVHAVRVSTTGHYRFPPKEIRRLTVSAEPGEGEEVHR